MATGLHARPLGALVRPAPTCNVKGCTSRATHRMGTMGHPLPITRYCTTHAPTGAEPIPGGARRG